MSNGFDIRENFILKLFDSLKESNSDVMNTLSKQTDAIDSLVKGGVQNEELKEILKEHSKESSEVHTKLFSRVNLMIACVAIAFTISAISYFFVKSSVDSMIDKRLQQHNVVMENDKDNIDYRYDELSRQIEKILDKIEELHGSDNGYTE